MISPILIARGEQVGSHFYADQRLDPPLQGLASTLNQFKNFEADIEFVLIGQTHRKTFQSDNRVRLTQYIEKPADLVGGIAI